MNPLQSGIPTQHYTASVNSAHPPEAAGSQAQSVHPGGISPFQLSHTAHLALDQIATQPNLEHQRVASLVRNALQDGSFRLRSTSSMEATYQAPVYAQLGANATSLTNVISTELTIRTRLINQSQYDIVSAHLRDLSGVISINLSAPPPASAHGQASSALSGQRPPISSHQDAQSSRGQLAQATIGQNYSRNSGPRLPSGASGGTQSMVFSHDGSAGASTGVPGPSRPRLPQTARSEPYPTSSQSGASSSRGINPQVPDPAHPGQTISRSTLSKRQQVPDPAHPGQTISRSTLGKRQQVPDPAHPGQTISRSTLSKRQQVPDPAHPGQTISQGLRNSRQQVPDPAHPGQTISRTALSKRQQVPDPAHPGQTISRSKLDKRKSLARAATRAAEAENV